MRWKREYANSIGSSPFLKRWFYFDMIFAHSWAFLPAELIVGYLQRIYFQHAAALYVRTSTFVYMNFCALLLDEGDKEGRLISSLEPENCFIIFNTPLSRKLRLWVFSYDLYAPFSGIDELVLQNIISLSKMYLNSIIIVCTATILWIIWVIRIQNFRIIVLGKHRNPIINSIVFNMWSLSKPYTALQ